MKDQQKIVVALVALVAVGGALFAQQQKNQAETKAHSPGAAASALPEIKLGADDLDKVTKLEIANGAKGTVVLEKQGDQWKVTKPVSYLASAQNVKSLLDNLKDLKVKDTIDPGKDQYAAFELDDAKAVHVQAFKGADKAVDLYFGKSGTRGQMTRIGGKDGVYISSGYSSFLYNREVKNWRDTEIFKFEDGNVISATITNENGAFSFSKNDDKWSATFKKDKIEGFDPEKVKDMLRAYKALTAEDFGDDKADADTGLDKPLATVTLTLKDNAPGAKLVVGKTATGSSHYARKEGSPTVFVVSSWASDWATSAVSKFQKPSDKDAGADKKK